MSNFLDFNTADNQNGFDVIPKGTLVNVRLKIKPGGYNEEALSWTGGYATRSQKSGAVYLNCEFTILDGKYAKRKVFSLIGLRSPKGEHWGQMGRALCKAIINSAHGLRSDDMSPEAQQKRKITGLGDLNGVEFLAKIDTDEDDYHGTKNIIRHAVTAEHPQYAEHRVKSPLVSPASAQHPPASESAPSAKPAWAQ